MNKLRMPCPTMRPGSKRSHRAARGYTLIELSLAMVIAALIGMTIWHLAPMIQRLPAVARLTAPATDVAEQALHGFILANGRLPCPASTVGGGEDCARAETTGWLPAQTLGIHTREAIRYGVSRAPSNNIVIDADLAVAKDRFTLLMPPGAAAIQTNGLDFCAALSNAVRQPGASLTGGAEAVPIAYGLATAGASRQFSGLNTQAGRFELNGTARTASYDNDTRTVGAAELFSRIGCVDRMASANSAARAAYAAYDADRLAAMVLRFRTFAVTVRELNAILAGVGVALATADLIDAVATTATAIALAVETAGGLSGAIVGGTLAIAAATAAEVAAITSTVTAALALEKAKEQKSAADQYKTVVGAEVIAAVNRAHGREAKGLLP